MGLGFMDVDHLSFFGEGLGFTEAFQGRSGLKLRDFDSRA